MSEILIEMSSREGQREIANAITNIVNPVISNAVRAETAASNAESSYQRANTAANNASSSANRAEEAEENANATSAALTEFLATKQTITAPAVDDTLSVVGAAADAFRAGASIKGVEGLKSALLRPPFENGRNINANGTIGTNSKRIATVQFIDISNAKSINYRVQTGYRMYFFMYSSNNESSFTHSTGGWVTGSDSIYFNDDDKYLRCTLASVDDVATVTTSDSNKATVTAVSKIVNCLNKETLRLQSSIYGTVDFNTLYTTGIYNVTTSVSNDFSHIPEGFEAGTLLIMPGYSDGAVVQMLVSPYNKNIWMRYCNPSHEWRDWISVKETTIVQQTNWLAIGDSITKGVYSDSSGTYDGTAGWTTHLAKTFGYNITKKGIRGMGYIAVGGNQITFEQTLQEVEAMTDDFNLVTVALGINDYNTSTVSISSLRTVIRDSIQRITSKFPSARVVYITPFNSNRRGDVSTKYCYNYQFSDRSLKDIADLIKSCCEEYGVECIYATDGFLFNSYNMNVLLPDNTHPSVTGHRLIAKTMAHELFY